MSAVLAPAEQHAAVQRAWAVLHTVLDPEVPALSLCDLGIVREVNALANEIGSHGTGSHAAGIHVVLTPTYSGCPATEVIANNVREALQGEGFEPVHIEHRLAPAWSSDWISVQGRAKLKEAGIAPPQSASACGLAQAAIGARSSVQTAPLRYIPRRAAPALECPRCSSPRTEQLSAFGSTACKALYRCMACREPFEYFKPL